MLHGQWVFSLSRTGGWEGKTGSQTPHFLGYLPVVDLTSNGNSLEGGQWGRRLLTAPLVSLLLLSPTSCQQAAYPEVSEVSVAGVIGLVVGL